MGLLDGSGGCNPFVHFPGSKPHWAEWDFRHAEDCSISVFVSWLLVTRMAFRGTFCSIYGVRKNLTFNKSVVNRANGLFPKAVERALQGRSSVWGGGGGRGFLSFVETGGFLGFAIVDSMGCRFAAKNAWGKEGELPP